MMISSIIDRGNRQESRGETEKQRRDIHDL